MESTWLLPDLDEPTPRRSGKAPRAASCSCRRAARAGRGACRRGRCARAAGRSTSRGCRRAGAATIWSFIVPHPPLLPAYAEVAPYNAIVVELDEDPTIRFAGNLVASADGAINEIDPATIEIGEPVASCSTQIEDVVLPRWVRVGGDDGGADRSVVTAPTRSCREASTTTRSRSAACC